MTEQEFKYRVIKENLGEDCVTNENEFVNAPFVIGCVLKDGNWNVYKTDERGQVIIILETQDENMAFEELYKRLVRKKRIKEIEDY